MDLVIVPYYAASLALIFVFLSGHVIRGRREQKVAIGAPRAGDLERRVRVHANFAEYTPFALVLIAMAEIRGAPPYVLHTVCLALLLGRVCHAWGVSQADEDFRFRAAGTAMTLAAIVGAALELVMGRGTRDGEGACSTCGASAALPISAAMDLDFTDAELHRYSRHILLAEVGAEGQARLRAARVLVVGAGGLGAPLALYLAAAGVGTLGLVDHDRLELSNLQRQVVHSTARIGRNKAESAAETLHALNPEVRVEAHALRLDAASARDLIPRYDLVCDGTDNFGTRFLLGDACHLLGRTLVSAAVLRFEGQLSTFKAHLGPPHPCHRCLHPEPPPPGLVPSCSEAGVLGAVTGVMGTLQATEALKELLGIGEGMSGRLLLWDALDARFRTVRLRRDPGCALCGEAVMIRDLRAHA